MVLGGLVALGRTSEGSEELGARGADVFTAQRVCAYGRVCRGARWIRTPSAPFRSSFISLGTPSQRGRCSPRSTQIIDNQAAVQQNKISELILFCIYLALLLTFG